MVKGQTANEIGDWLIASLQDPYKNIVRVIDYDILAGVSNDNTPYFCVWKSPYCSGREDKE